MKKAKRMLSLVLAVMLVMSVFVLPASAAAPDDEVEPCAEYIRCPKCYFYDAYVTDTYERYVSTKYVESCGSLAGAHPHDVYGYYISYNCTNCGAFTLLDHTWEVCF